jgi:hypothetical protein
VARRRGARSRVARRIVASGAAAGGTARERTRPGGGSRGAQGLGPGPAARVGCGGRRRPGLAYRRPGLAYHRRALVGGERASRSRERAAVLGAIGATADYGSIT